MTVVSTVADGDCGIDAMLHMIGVPSSAQARSRLREDPHMGPLESLAYESVSYSVTVLRLVDYFSAAIQSMN